MNTIKSAVGLGKKDQEGEEPVSGEQGEGTTAEPLDAGNKQAQADASKDSGDRSTSNEEKPDSNADTTEGSKKEEQTSESESPKEQKKGGWLKAVNPFSKSKKEDDEDSKQASAGAGRPKGDQEEEKKLPPNVLGTNVPSGASTDFAPPGTPGEGASTNEAKKTMSQVEDHNQSVVNASADNVDEGKFGQAGLLQPGRSGSSQGPSVSQLRGSRASIAEPTKQRVFNPHSTNPGRIPTAGGVAVGSKQYEQRRASRVSQDLAPPEKKPSLDQEGSPDTTTQSNTVSNAVPQGPSSPPIMEDEEGGPKDTRATPQINEPEPSSTAAASGTEDKSKVEELKDKAKEAKENLPSPSAAGSKPSTGGESKERRGSSFERFKSKLSGKK